MHSNALAVMPLETMLTRIEGAKFPQEMTPPEKTMLAQAAIIYALDPVMGELMLYQGHLYVSIDGRYRKAQETGRLDGVSTRPATKAERQEWDIPDEDFFFRSEVYVKGCGHPFVGWGRVRSAEAQPHPDPRRRGFRPLETNPQRMAENRAEAQALRKGFHIPLPSAEAIGEEQSYPDAIDTEGRELPDEEPGLQVNSETGEITEPDAPKDTSTTKRRGEMREVRCQLHDKPLVKGKYGPYCPTRITGPDGKERWCKGQAAHGEPVEPREEAASPEPPLENPTRGTTTALADVRVDSLAELFNACSQHFGIKSWPEIFRILNVPDKMAIADVDEAWLTICAHNIEPTVAPENDPYA